MITITLTNDKLESQTRVILSAHDGDFLANCGVYHYLPTGTKKLADTTGGLIWYFFFPLDGQNGDFADVESAYTQFVLSLNFEVSPC